MPPACPAVCVRRAEASCYRLRGVVDRSTTRTCAATKNPRPAESAAVRGGKLQSKGLGFGARCKKPSRLHTLLTHRNVWHAGWRLKRAFRFRKVLWLLFSKESNNKKKLCSNTALCLRHGVGRDAPVLGWRSGRESRATCVAPDSCPGFFSTKVHEGHEEEYAGVDATAVGTCLRLVLRCVWVALKLNLRLWGLVDRSAIRTRGTRKPPHAKSSGVSKGRCTRGRKVSVRV
jgi:hypothetical protein